MTSREPRVPQRAAPRRTAILASARRLFAAHGIGPVTTNRIAEEAGISPGNLYYWFPAKTDLVRALFAEWTEREAPSAQLGDDPADALRLLWERATELPRPDQDYAFFLRDLFPLLHADPELAAQYRANYADRVAHYTALVDGLIAAGLLSAPEPPTTPRDLVGLLWLVDETAPPFAQAADDPGADPRRYGRAVFQPLLTPEGRRVLGLPARPGGRA